jgi:hypothetical protein
MSLWLETEKLKLMLLSAYARLVDEGQLSEAQLDQITDLLEDMHKYSQEDFSDKLREICGFIPGEEPPHAI